MNPIKKNILVNAAMSCNQDCEKTLAMVAGHLTITELKKTKKLMTSGININHKTVNRSL